MGDAKSLTQAEREATRQAILEYLQEFSESALGTELGVSQAAVNKAAKHGELGRGMMTRMMAFLDMNHAEFMARYGTAYASPVERAVSAATIVHPGDEACRRAVRDICHKYEAAPPECDTETLLHEILGVRRQILASESHLVRTASTAADAIRRRVRLEIGESPPVVRRRRGTAT